MKVIIAELNKHKKQEDFYSGLHEFPAGYYRRMLSSVKERFNVKDIEVAVVFKFEELEAELQKAEFGMVKVFSNFPGNKTYKTYQIRTSRSGNSYVPGGGYGRTFANYHKLLKKYYNFSLHIVTGAMKSLMFDSEVRLMSKHHLITIKHASDFPVYDYDSYMDYIVEMVNGERRE